MHHQLIYCIYIYIYTYHEKNFNTFTSVSVIDSICDEADKVHAMPTLADVTCGEFSPCLPACDMKCMCNA